MRPSALFCTLLSMTLTAGGLPAHGGSDFQPRHGYMHPTLEQRQRWEWQHRHLPETRLEDKHLASAMAGTLPSQYDLFSYLDYTPAERNQGACGNCWVWASTAMTEIALSANYGLKDRLSPQYFDSASASTKGYACNGGNLSTFADWSNSSKTLVPWANANAAYRDGYVNDYCTQSLVDPTTIATAPSYVLTQMTNSQISTWGKTQADMITAIKTALSQNQAVGFSFTTNFDDSTNGFYTFWDNQPEATLWVNAFEGGTYSSPSWGSHMVTIVGYDETDANVANHYWIVLNSWGTTSTRTTGTFRMPMMMNYQAVYDGSSPCYSFETLDLQMTPPTSMAPTASIVVAPSSPIAGDPLTLTAQVGGTPPFTYQWRMDSVAITGANQAQLFLPCVPSDGGHSYDVVVTNALSSATSDPVSLSITGQQLLNDPGFENETSTYTDPSWVMTTTDSNPNPYRINLPANAHTGNNYVFLGMDNSQAKYSGSFLQTVSIPSDVATARLSWWMRSSTGETVSADVDTLSVELVDGSSQIQTLKTYSNQTTDHLVWARDEFDVSAYKGQTIQVGASWVEGGSSYTSFRLDDLALTTTTSQSASISGFSPASGPVGVPVTITGTGFTGATAVAFKGTPATSFHVASDTSITANVPLGAVSGTLSVTTANGTATSTGSFTVTASPAPTLASFTPASGSPGTLVTLTGTGFYGATSVSFNGTQASTFTITSDTAITATVPVGATSGTLSVATPGGVATSSGSFTVVPSAVVTISPKPDALLVGGQISLTASVTGGTGNTSVTWQVSPSGAGSFSSTTSSTSIYTAPSAKTTVTITAASVDDPSKSDTLVLPVLDLDLNGDSATNVLDMGAMAASYGSKLGDTPWNLQTDLNGDGQITDADIDSLLQGLQ